MITHLLDRVRSERDRRNWNHAVRYARPGDHATATVIGPGWITWDEDLIPTWDPPMLTQPVTALAVAPVGTKVTVWWIRDDEPLMRYAVQGQIIAGADPGEILVGDLDGQAESVPLASITAARLGWVTAVTR